LIMSRIALHALMTVLAMATSSCSSSSAPDLDIPIASSTRLLVLAPHPDDEALAAAGLIQRVRAAGGAVRVVLMTSGDAFAEKTARRSPEPDAADHRKSGVIRERESVAAMARLGVARADVTMLGFPDMGLCFLASKYLTNAGAFESPYTDRERPPASKQVIRGVEYRGVDVRLELEKVIAGFMPTLVVLPHGEDEHPDHCATQIFGRRALELLNRRLGLAPRVLHYVVHYADWPLSQDGGTGAQLDPPAGFPAAEGQWRSLTLSDAEAEAKRLAIGDYATQMRAMGTFLQAFARHNELFVDGAPASPPECWCDEKTVATTLPAASHRHRPKPRP
jgi:LmbE family N-acetylglucosaminyl deacetylase